MKILVFLKNWVGDTLFQIPALEMIQKRYPHAHIVCIAPRRCREILENHPAVSRVIVFDEKKEHRFPWDRFKFLIELRREQWDKGFLFHRSRSRAFMFWLGGVKERIGYAGNRRFLLTKAITEPETPMHQLDYFVELLVREGFQRSEKPAYSFYVSAQDNASAAQILQKHGLKEFVCFHLGANWEPKRWPVEHFAKLADLIYEKWKLPVVLTGASGDKALAEELIKKSTSAQIIALTGKTRLGELAGIYQRAAFVVSGDSGPMHIASAVGTPVAALFGPTDPQLTGPRGKGDTLVLSHVPEGFSVPWIGDKLPEKGWLSEILPEKVFEEIEKKNWVKTPHPLMSFPHVFPPEAGPPSADKREFNPLDPGLKSCRDDNSFQVAQHVRKILVVTLSNIGDVILTTPVITALAHEFPSAKITVVVGPRPRGILDGSRFIHRLIVYDKQASLMEKWMFLKEIQQSSYDWVVDLRNTAIPFLVKARKRSLLFRDFSHLPLRERHLAVLKQMGLAPASIPPFDFFNAREEKSISKKLEEKGIPQETDFILIAPFAADRLKTWPKEHYLQLIRSLTERRSEPILLTGGKREKSWTEEMEKIAPGKVFSLAGEMTLRETSALISRATLVVANDSSVMHFAHELNRPVVAIFGPTDHTKSGRVGPYFRTVRLGIECSPCNKSYCRFERQFCMDDLGIGPVLETCLELLEKKNEYPCHSH